MAKSGKKWLYWLNFTYLAQRYCNEVLTINSIIMKTKVFNRRENKVLTEVYRRLNYFHKGNLDERLMLLALPSEVKSLIEKAILKPYGKEVKRAYNWYNLTDKGKELFSTHVTKERLSDDDAFAIFKGLYVRDFN